MDKFILAVDQGTTSSRSMIFNSEGKVISSAQKEFKQIYPQSAWVEHDPEQIWTTVEETANEALKQAGLTAQQIAAIGITNQRETTVVWNKRTGKPVQNAIVWQDRRTSRQVDNLREHESEMHQTTGLALDAYFSASKVQWILDNNKGARELAEAGDLAFGTVDSWLIFKMTGGSKHITDHSNASRTLLFDIHNMQWSERMLELFEIPASMLPEVVKSSEVVGHWNIDGHDIPIAGIAGDQQAATFGQLAHSPGTAKNTYGTGCFLVLPTGNEPTLSKHKLLSTVAWTLPESTCYALEGSLFTTGAAIGWLKEGLGIIEKDSDVEALASSVSHSDGVMFVPAMAGLGAPYWDQYARGTILGITRGTTKAHIARATLEGIALQVVDIVEAAKNDLGFSLETLRVDGGATKCDLLMQLQADLLQIPVERPKMTELTAKGAAFLAGLAVGYWKSTEELEKVPEQLTTFEPKMKDDEREFLIGRWKRAVERAKLWEDQ